MKYAKGARSKKPTHTKSFLYVLVAGIAAICLVLAAAYVWYNQQLKPVTKTDTYIDVTIDNGATASSVATKLETKKVIRSAEAFGWYLRTNGLRDDLQAGTYKLNSADSSQEIASAITEGKIKQDLFTILPGLRLDQIRTKFINAGYSEQEVDTALNAANYKNHPALADKPQGASLEGYLYPDSFQKTAATTAGQIVKQSLDEMADALTPEVLEGFQKQGLSPYQGITLASIVLKEANNSDDRRQVAGVFFNRLRSNIALGSDVTYQYIADITGQERSPFIDSPYNTRKYVGLPPGPISNVDKNSLTAVALPLPTDNLFFVAGDNGNVYFSRTQAEHEALIAKYCIKLCSVY